MPAEKLNIYIYKEIGLLYMIFFFFYIKDMFFKKNSKKKII